MRVGTGRDRGFTLVELMIGVAIIGVLAALAMMGVRRYLTAAKASEAKQSVGHISRSAHAAFEREMMQSQSVNEGGLSITQAHGLCGTAPAVPAVVPAGRKYQPSTVNGADFETGDDDVGWKCLRFRVHQPIYYQYIYTEGSSPVAPANPANCAGQCYEAAARGDTDADGTFSVFARTGHVNVATGRIKASSQVYVQNEAE